MQLFFIKTQLYVGMLKDNHAFFIKFDIISKRKVIGMCIFCDIKKNPENRIHENEFVFSVYDNYPVSKGHALIITKRHVETYFELNIDEKKALDQEIIYLKKFLDQKYNPDGYNIGINNGISAGQTIFHLHVHLIPRYLGDVVDPRGGVRGVIPDKQKY